MKTNPACGFLSTSYIFLVSLAAVAGARAVSFDLPLATPILRSIEAAVPVGSQTSAVSCVIVYTGSGQLALAATSTIDGAPASGRGTITKRGTSFVYTLKAATAGKPRTTVTLSGSVTGATARCVYAGGLGRANIAAQPVALDVAAATAHIDAAFAVAARGRLTGSGTIDAYGTNFPAPGKLTGSATSNAVSWTLKQGSRVLIFKGKRAGDVFGGSLKVTVPPDRETIQPYQVPATLFFPLPVQPASFSGMVALADSSGASALAGTAVTLKSDLNGDGEFTDSEVVTVTTDATGAYSAQLPAQPGHPVLLEMRRPGYARFLAAYQNVTAGASVTKSATLQPLAQAPVGGGTAKLPDGSFTLTGLPAAVTNIAARVFNPATESSQFPGEFADSDRNLLVSSVFAAIEANGGAVTNLGTNAQLSMLVPRATWSTMGDVVQANSQIDVPLYFYDETTGQWKRSSSDGWLETTNHLRLLETDLAAVRDGSYPGPIFVVGPVTHLSWWNADWPISTHTAIRGVILDPFNAPAQGATVIVRGTTYTGSSAPILTDASGAFCADVMRSENPGEDVDRNGISGETQQVTILVRSGLNLYSFGPYNTSVAQGSCDAGGGTDAGSLALTDASRVPVTLCTISGRVIFSGNSRNGTSPLAPGDPIAGALVRAFDPEDPDLANGCGTNCSPMAFTGADGSFTLVAPRLSQLMVSANAATPITGGIVNYDALVTLDDCPGAPITLSADYWEIRFISLDLSGTGVDSGSVVVTSNLCVAHLSSGSVDYTGYKFISGDRPNTLGPWLQIPLQNSDNGMSVGNLALNVTALDPLAGTWTASLLGLNGTFSETPPAGGAAQPLPGPGGIRLPPTAPWPITPEEAQARIEAQRRILEQAGPAIPPPPGMTRILPPTRFAPPPLGE